VLRINVDPQYSPMPVEEQVMVIYTAVNGYLDDIPVENISRFEQEFLKFMRGNYAEVGKSIREKKVIDPETESALQKAIKEFKDSFVTTGDAGTESAR